MYAVLCKGKTELGNKESAITLNPKVRGNENWGALVLFIYSECVS